MNNRGIINIKGNNQTFPYLLEYINDLSNVIIYSDDVCTSKKDIHWVKSDLQEDYIYILCKHKKYYRHKNDWYLVDKENIDNNEYIPENVKPSKIRIYIPNHNISTYKRGVTYIATCHTYINGYKIDLGSHVFKHTDAVAGKYGKIKYGNNEYFEYVEFDIIDPFDIIYSDDWKTFRNTVCEEPLGINNTGSLLCISLYSVDKYEDRYLMDPNYSGGITNFNISDDNDFLTLDLSYDNSSNLIISATYNKEYDWLHDYLKETYDINSSDNDIKFEIVMKTNNGIGALKSGIPYFPKQTFGFMTQKIEYKDFVNDEITSFKQFFNSWENFSEGWNFVASMMIYNEDGEEIFNLVSNELPITQEVFSRFVNGGSEQIIKLEDMEIKNYNVVNKIINEVVHVERPNDSKSHIIQPVFFRVKDTELLTLHPDVTENICINLDDYKSKVKIFTLMIDGVKFKQIGSNNYGILFKIVGNKIKSKNETGVYYILDDNMEMITLGKYNCVI